MKFNLRTKLLGGLAVMLLMLIVIGAVNIYVLDKTQNRLQSVIEQDAKSVEIVTDLLRRAGFVHSNCLLHLFHKSADDMDRYESEITDWVGKISGNLETLKGRLKDQAILDKLTSFETSWKTYLKVWDEQVKPMSRANRDEEAFALVRKRGPAGEAVREAMYKLNELYDRIIESAGYSVKLAEQDYKKGQLILLAIIIVAIIFCLAFGLRLSSRIAGPVNRVSKAAKRVAAGDLDQKVAVKTGDEIESMADSFNIMTGSMKKMVEELRHEITERHRTEEELRKHRDHLEDMVKERTETLRASEEKYRNIFNNAQVGIFRTSISDGKVLECNDRFARTYGYKTPEECKANYVLSEHYTDPGTREKMLASLIEEGEVNNFEGCFSRKDGEAVWTRFSARAYPEEGYLEGIGYDITEEKRGLEALRESEEQYRLLAENITDIIWTMDINLRFTYMSPSVTSLTGYSVDEAMALSLEEILTPASLENAVKVFGEELAADETQMRDAFSSRMLELEQRSKDGSTFWVEITTTFLRDPDGRPIGLVGVTRDISERKQAQKALINEKEKFQVLVEESPFGISIIGKDGHYRYTNPGFIEIFGYGIEDISTGKEWFRKAFPDAEYRHQVISTWIDDEKESKPGEPRPRIFTVMCKDGSQKEIQFIPVILKSGDQFVIYEDITKEKKLEDQLRQSQKMEGIGRLAGGVAHDFNNLLMSIMGHADLALMSLAEDDPLRRRLKEIKGGGKRAASLTRQLLAFSRKQILQPVVLDLNSLITGFVKMLERMIGEDMELETVLTSGLRLLEADPGQMEQIIMNLVINARDAMPGGGKLTIETVNVDLNEDYAKEHDVSMQPGPYVMLGVSDTGMGMDKKTKSLIFEPFFTTKEVGKGTGLGLSTVYGIVKQSGGYIWVYSEPGHGTTFKIYLPAVEGEAVSREKEEISPERLTGSETILIVEDDDKVRNLACEILEPQGYTILEAQNGIEALRVSESHSGQIHLMIADVVMPKMGGRELEEHLRPLRPEMKVIYMSGYTDNAILHHGVLSPGIEFLQKPFTPANLRKKVREVLDQ